MSFLKAKVEVGAKVWNFYGYLLLSGVPLRSLGSIEFPKAVKIVGVRFKTNSGLFGWATQSFFPVHFIGL